MVSRSIVAMLAVAIAACNSIIGNETGYYVVSAGDPCTLNSDCAGEQVCLFQRCSPACRADEDCGEGQRCLDTSIEDGTACVSSGQAKCEGDDCPSGTECIAGECRTICGESSPCRDDQRCADGACVGTNTVHDEGPDSLGSGGSRGAGGANAGGETSGAGGGATSCEEGSHQCSVDVLQVCERGEWRDVQRCTGSSCLAAEARCGKCAEGTNQCSGNATQACEGGAWGSLKACTGVSCSTETGRCGECITGDHLCEDGGATKACVDGAWAPPQACAPNSCSTATGLCGVCGNGGHRCSGNTQQLCVDGAWESEKACGAVSCAKVAGLCGGCSNGDFECSAAAPATSLRCEDGDWVTDEVCAGSANPLCDEGKCAACAGGAQDCASTVPRSCVNGSWVSGTACTQGNTCEAGACTCKQDVCGTACVNLQTDAGNCGTCGHSCRGSTCAGGKCQPVTLATGESTPGGIATNGQDLFWTTPSALRTLNLSTGVASTIAVPANCYQPNSAVLLRPGKLYWATTTNACTMTVPERVFTETSMYSANARSLYEIAANSSAFYVWNVFDGWIESDNAGNYSGVTGGLRAIVADDKGVYWLEGQTVKRHDPLGLSTIAATTIDSGTLGLTAGIAVHKDVLYFTGNAGSSNGNHVIYTRATSGAGSRQTVASGHANITGLAVDDSGIYWTVMLKNTGSVWKSRHDGIGAVAIATNQNEPKGIALDSSHVYWTNVAGGQVVKVAK